MVRRYLLAVAAGNLVWEVAQLPLYTLWQDGTPGSIAFAVLHCTAGDVAIAAAALTLALVLVGSPEWPTQRFGPVLVACVAVGVAYTAYSEYLNVVVRRAWAYSTLMPVLPGSGIGLAPLAQWIVLPSLALVWGRYVIGIAGKPGQVVRGTGGTSGPGKAGAVGLCSPRHDHVD
jgi:hypothetical protein